MPSRNPSSHRKQAGVYDLEFLNMIVIAATIVILFIVFIDKNAIKLDGELTTFANQATEAPAEDRIVVTEIHKILANQTGSPVDQTKTMLLFITGDNDASRYVTRSDDPALAIPNLGAYLVKNPGDHIASRELDRVSLCTITQDKGTRCAPGHRVQPDQVIAPR